MSLPSCACITAQLCQCHCQAVPTSLPDCASITDQLCLHHCPAMASSLPNSSQLLARPCPAHCQALTSARSYLDHCQAMPGSPPGSFPGLFQISTKLCPAHCQDLPSSPQQGPKNSSRAHHACCFFHCRLSTVERFSRICSCNPDSNLCPAQGKTTAWDKHPNSLLLSHC